MFICALLSYRLHTNYIQITQISRCRSCTNTRFKAISIFYICFRVSSRWLYALYMVLFKGKFQRELGRSRKGGGGGGEVTIEQGCIETKDY